MIAALAELKSQKSVDSKRIGAMGSCFGGKAVLDLARTGEKFEADVSLHGVYDAPTSTTSEIVLSVMALRGFGHTGHAFTNPNAQEPDEGMVYSQRATHRSWKILTDFFHEKLRI